MNRYLEKIAKEYYTQTRVEDADTGRKFGAAVVGGVTAGIVNKKIGPMLQKPVMNIWMKRAPSIPHETLKSISEDVLPRTNTTLSLDEIGGGPHTRQAFRTMLSNSGPGYLDKSTMPFMKRVSHMAMVGTNAGSKLWSKITGTPHVPMYNGEIMKEREPFVKNHIHFPGGNTDVLVHEMGHAVDLNKGMRRSKMLSYALSSKLSGFGGAAIGGSMLASDKTKDYAWAAPLAIAAPTLRAEYMANHHAMKLIKAHGGMPRKFAPLAAANLLSYVAAPALASLTLAGINHARKKGEEVNPEEWIKQE